MAIPDFQTLMLPLLQAVKDGRDYTLKALESQVGGLFFLTEEEMRVLLPSGGAPLFYNRLAWAKTHLKKAGLIAQSKRGVFHITAVGKDLLQSPPSRIDMAFLQRYVGYARAPSAALESPVEAVRLSSSNVWWFAC